MKCIPVSVRSFLVNRQTTFQEVDLPRFQHEDNENGKRRHFRGGYRLTMRNFCAVALVLATTLTAGTANAEVTLFKGDPITTVGITVNGWGSGTAVESSRRYYEGSRSIEISTQGLHEGGRIDFRNPIEMIEPTIDENEYLQLVVGFTSLVRSDASAFVGPGFGVKSAPGFSVIPEVSVYYFEEEIPTRPKVNNIRIVLESDNNRSIDATVDVQSDPDDGWYKVSIPLKTFGLKKGDSFKVKRVLVFSDVPDVLYVGRIGTVTDSDPIQVQSGDEQVVAIGDTVTFRADADGGACMLKYSWNFGDRGGTGEDTTGQVVSHAFKRGGDYDVTLTVSDVWGVKKPVKTIFKVSVND